LSPGYKKTLSYLVFFILSKYKYIVYKSLLIPYTNIFK